MKEEVIEKEETNKFQLVDKDEKEHEQSFGDMSSIMINPDQIYNDFNLMEDE